MIFLIVAASSLFIWLALGQRKLISVSSGNLLATLLFVDLGLQLEPYRDIGLTILIGIGFYLFLVIGERCARLVPINTERLGQYGQTLTRSGAASSILTIVFVLLSILPALAVWTSGQSIADLFTATWATNNLEVTSENLLAQAYGAATGSQALLKGIQGQLGGFWYLSVGIVLARKSRWLYPALAVFLFGSLLISGGYRSMVMAYLLIPVLLFLSSNSKTPRVRTLILVGLLVVGMLVALDWLRYGRQGMVADGTFQQRIDRTLRTDFAYGGLGLNLGLSSLPDSLDVGIDYLARIAVLPIPRGLWAGKPTLSPNQVLTERTTGTSLANYGNILLFTPLGEALYYFGYTGVVVIPFLYGFTTALLERLYRTSTAYRGMLVQVYIWSFLAMRLTFLNLYSSLVAANFTVICALLVGSRWSVAHRLSPRRIVHGG